MPTFQLFIDDDRYAAPTLKILVGGDAAWARTSAKQALNESPHHVGVELFDGDRRLFALGSLRLAHAAQPRPRCASF